MALAAGMGVGQLNDRARAGVNVQHTVSRLLLIVAPPICSSSGTPGIFQRISLLECDSVSQGSTLHLFRVDASSSNARASNEDA